MTVLSYETWYPDLFAPLTDRQKWGIEQALANGRLEGWEPTRDDVADLIDVELGRIDDSEYTHRTMARARQVGAHTTAV